MNQIVPNRIGIVDLEAQTKSGEQHEIPQQACSGSLLRDDGEGAHVSLRPLHDRVLVRRVEPSTASRIIVPDVANPKPLRGVVLATGPGKKDGDGVFRETMVKPGDEVLFSASINVPYPDLIEDGDLVMMNEADILGILSNS